MIRKGRNKDETQVDQTAAGCVDIAQEENDLLVTTEGSNGLNGIIVLQSWKLLS